MDHTTLSCLICLNKYSKFFELKNHVCSGQHRQKFKAVFQEEQSRRKAWIPYIDFLKPQYLNQPRVGVSLLTLCYCTESMTCFYLCHVCEEKCEPDMILDHLFSADHCSNYFSYTDPDVLSFSWIPSMDMKATLRPWIIKEVNKKGSGTIQLLDLPAILKKKLDTCSYSEVMNILRENDKLLKVLEAVKPQRMMIQTYQKAGNRKHQLIGMQHIVECICVGQTDKRYYLCTLCKLTVATSMIISHVLSFDHIRCYFKVWYPSSLLPKKSTKKSYSNSFVNSMLDITKQTLELDGTANAEIKQVSLDPAEFASVNFTCYEEAFQKLESITKETNGSSLITPIKPSKLKCCSVSVKSEASLYKLRCQNCSIIFETQSEYMKHLSEQRHTQMWEKLKQAGGSQSYEQTVTVKFSLDLYTYLQESMEQNEPAVGVSLVVACVSSRVQVEPIYICFACQNCFPESFLRQHFKSEKHLILTLLYQNPWELPFAWKSHLDLKVLKTKAWEEAKARGPDEMILKVFDIPYSIFHCLIPPSYLKVMEKLVLFHTHLRNKVPQCETYSRLQQNQRFPLLGKQFLVIHACVMDDATKVGFLCLLCEDEITDDDFYAHVFSWKHVATFLNRFHPGSLSGNTDAVTLLDLAKQAAGLHPTSNEQVINLNKPIYKPCSYEKVLQILATAKRRHGGGQLEPIITPKYKLFPRQSQKEVGKDTVRDDTQENSGAEEELEKKNCVKSNDNQHTIEKVSVEPSSEIIKNCSIKNEDNLKDGDNKEIHMPYGAEAEQTKDVFSKMCPDEVQNAVEETCQRIKEEIIEETKVEIKKDIKKEIIDEHKMREQISEIPQSYQNTISSEHAQTEQKSRETTKGVPRPRNVMFNKNERKRPYSLYDKSSEVAYPNEDMKEVKAHKRQRSSSEKDAPFEESQNMQCDVLTDPAAINKRENDKLCPKIAKTKAISNKKKLRTNRLWNYIQKMHREPVIGLSSLLECHCDQRDPIYLCETCSLKLGESRIIAHVSGYEHHKKYMMTIQKISSQLETKKSRSRKNIRRLAGLVEQTEGYGEAQVIDLSKDIYQLISKQQFNLATQTLKAFQTQQDSRQVLFQVMEIDSDSNTETKLSSETTPMSVVTETTFREDPPESKADVKITNAERSVRTHSLSVAEDASSVHVSKSRTNMARLRSASIETNSENKIVQNKALEPLVTKTTSKIMGTSQAQAISDFSINTSSESLAAAISSCTAKLAMCPLDSTAVTVTASISSCTAATTSLGKMTNKCSSATDGTTGSTAKLTSGCSTDRIKCTQPAYKCTTSLSGITTIAKSSTSTIGTATTSEYTAASSSLTGTTFTSNVTALNIASTPKSTMLKPWKSTNETWSKTTGEASCIPAPISQSESTVFHQTTCMYTQPEKLSQPKVANTVAAMKAKTSVKSENNQAAAQAAHMKNVKGANAGNPPAAPLAASAISVSSGHSSPSMEPSHTHTMKTKPKENRHKVGFNELIIVNCEKRRQVYCKLCSKRLKESGHTSTFTHQSNYVKKLYGPNTETSNFEKIIAHLAEAEKIGTRKDQISSRSVEVKNDVYEELAALRDDKAIEKLKDILKQKALQVPSVSTTDNAEVKLQVVGSSPCEVLSPHNGICVPMNQASGPSVKNQPPQENIRVTHSPCASEEANHLNGALSSTEKGPRPIDRTPDLVQPDLLLKSDPDPIPTPIQEADTTVSVSIKQEGFDPYFDAQTHIEVTSAIQSSVPVEKPHGCPDSVATDSESTHTSLVTSIKQEPLSQDEPRPSLTVEHGPFFDPGPEQHSPSQVLPKAAEGKENLTCMEGLDTEPIIGLGFVWKCHGTSGSSFFLCESCEEMFSTSHISHASSPNHWYKYIQWQHPSFVKFWDEDFPAEVKLKALRCAAIGLSLRENCYNVTVQNVLLEPELYEHVRSAPFREALQMVQNIRKEENRSVLSLPSSSSPVSAKNPEARQKSETHQETVKAGDLDGGKSLKSCLVDVSGVSSKVDSVISPLHCISTSGEAHRKHISPPEFRHPVFSQQNIPKLRMKHTGVNLESQSFHTSSPKTIQTPSLFVSNKRVPNKKRPADPFIETVDRTCRNNNSQLEGLLPPKRTHISLPQQSQPSPKTASDSTSLYPAAASTTLLPEKKDKGAGSEDDNRSIVHMKLMEDLIALVKLRKRNTASPCKSAPDNSIITTPPANSSLSTDAEGRLDSLCMEAEIKVPEKTTTLHSVATPGEVLDKNSNATPNFTPFLSANNLCLESSSTGNNPSPRSEATGVGTLLPSVTTADTCVQLLQPQDNGKTSTTGAHLLPNVPIVTARSNHCKQQQLIDSQKRQNHQMDFTFGQSGALSSWAVTDYMPNNPPVYTQGLYQHEGYAARGLYPGSLYPNQEATQFHLQSYRYGFDTSTMPGSASLEITQQHQKQQQLQKPHLQLQQQQQLQLQKPHLQLQQQLQLQQKPHLQLQQQQQLQLQQQQQLQLQQQQQLQLQQKPHLQLQQQQQPYLQQLQQQQQPYLQQLQQQQQPYLQQLQQQPQLQLQQQQQLRLQQQ